MGFLDGLYYDKTGLRLLSPMKAGNFYTQPFQGGIATRSLSQANNFAVPMWVPACSIDQISCSVTVVGTASEVIRMGIYADTGFGEPGSLLGDAGTAAAGTSDGATVKTLTFASVIVISQPSLIWLCACGQVVTTAPTIRGIANTTIAMGAAAATSVLDAQGACYFVGSITGAFPATFGTPTVTTTAPRLAIRIA